MMELKVELDLAKGEIARLRSDLDVRRNETVRLGHELDAAKTETNTLKAHVDAANQSSKSLQGKASGLESEVIMLASELREARSLIAALREKAQADAIAVAEADCLAVSLTSEHHKATLALETAQSRIRILEDELLEEKKKCVDVEASWAVVSTETETLRDKNRELAAIEKELERQQLELSEQASEQQQSDNCESYRQSMLAELRTKQEEVFALQGQIEELVNGKLTLEQRLRVCEEMAVREVSDQQHVSIVEEEERRLAESVGLLTRVSALEKQKTLLIQAHHSELSSIEAENLELHLKLQEALQELTTSTGEVSALQATIARQQSDIEASGAQILSLKALVDGAQTQSETGQTELVMLTAKLSDLETSRLGLDGMRSLQQERLVELTADLAIANNQIKSLEFSVSLLEAARQSLTADVAEGRRVNEVAQAKISAYEGLLSDLRSALEESCEETAALSADRKEMREQLSDQQERLERSAVELNAARGEVLVLARREEDLRSDLQLAELSLESAKTELKESEADRSLLQHRVLELERQKDLLLSEHGEYGTRATTELHERLDQVLGELGEGCREINLLRATIDQLEATQTQSESVRIIQEQRLRELTEELEDSRSEVESLKWTVVELDSARTELENRAVGRQQRIEELMEQTNTNATEIAELKLAIVTLEDELSLTSATCSAQQTRIDELNAAAHQAEGIAADQLRRLSEKLWEVESLNTELNVLKTEKQLWATEHCLLEAYRSEKKPVSAAENELETECSDWGAEAEAGSRTRKMSVTVDTELAQLRNAKEQWSLMLQTQLNNLVDARAQNVSLAANNKALMELLTSARASAAAYQQELSIQSLQHKQTLELESRLARALAEVKRLKAELRALGDVELELKQLQKLIEIHPGFEGCL